MPISNLEDVEVAISTTLKEAMANERSKRWSKVVHNYRRLLRMINPQNLPPGFTPPQAYIKLLYELHYHLGLALQHVNEHKKAVIQYSMAIQAVSIPKNGCTAGCNSNSCLMTPIFARRAFANAAAGDLLPALKDAERTVVLDNRNPDVYCIRAMVKNTRGKENEAVKDVEEALRINPNHPCALILHGTLKAPVFQTKTAWAEPSIDTMHPDHIKACSINPDCHNYLDVTDFKHPDCTQFYERFLFSLGVPHTISSVKLVFGSSQIRQNRRLLSRQPSTSTNYSSRPPSGVSTNTNYKTESTSTFRNPMKFLQPAFPDQSQNQKPAFRCGIQPEKGEAFTAVRRRREYGAAIRDCMSQPKTADEYIALLEKQTQLSTMSTIPRPKSAQSVPSSFQYGGKKSGSRTDNPLWRGSSLSVGTSHKSRASSQTSSTTSYPIQVFQKTNVQDAPRMYYKPWNGDKLPVAYREENGPKYRPFIP